ncbi:hypothetical protein EC968_009768 [Mortierella alpina]|nr:hypothetical protein EC968_009768 [Mortierella alpina]
MGLHRQDLFKYNPEQTEIRRRIWWFLYVCDRFHSAAEGRPVCIQDSAFRVPLQPTPGLLVTLAKSPDESSYESESVISDRLFWTVKLAILLGRVLNTMHSIEAETNDEHLAELSRNQLPLLHNEFTAWYLGLPAELVYTPYTISSEPQYNPSPATAFLQIFYYTSLIKLHFPLSRDLRSGSIDVNVLTTSRNICTAAAVNIGHIADSLLLHGSLRDMGPRLFSCFMSAKIVFLQNAMTFSVSSREATLTGLYKILKCSLELAKTYPFLELLPALLIDILSSQNTAVPQNVEAIFYEISDFLAQTLDPTQFRSTAKINLAARMAKFSKTWSGQVAPCVEVHHSDGLLSMTLPDDVKGQQVEDVGTMWQDQMMKAANLLVAALAAETPQAEQRFYTDPLELPADMRLEPIEELLFGDLFATPPQEFEQ